MFHIPVLDGNLSYQMKSLVFGAILFCVTAQVKSDQFSYGKWFSLDMSGSTWLVHECPHRSPTGRWVSPVGQQWVYNNVLSIPSGSWICTGLLAWLWTLALSLCIQFTNSLQCNTITTKHCTHYTYTMLLHYTYSIPTHYTIELDTWVVKTGELWLHLDLPALRLDCFKTQAYSKGYDD